jgi:putative hydrolase of HD superfamily
LKNIKRGGNVGRRKESTAEHVFSSLVLARYYLKKINGLDEKKVMKLLLYHDMVEVHSGDIKAWTGRFKVMKEKKELASFNKLLKTLPFEIRKEFHDSWLEYSSGKTREALFCHAIDHMDAMINNINDAKLFERYSITAKRIMDIKGKYYAPFPLLKKDLMALIVFLRKKGIMKQ